MQSCFMQLHWDFYVIGHDGGHESGTIKRVDTYKAFLKLLP